MKQDAIICGHIGEFGWEVLRFAPHVFWLMKQNPKAKLLLYTREDRVDLYGDLPERVMTFKSDEKIKSDCFTITGITNLEYLKIQNELYERASKEYNVIDTFFPIIIGKRYTEKAQILESEKIYDFKPKVLYSMAFDNYVKTDKPIVTLAPRFRDGFARNWPHWEEFYKKLSTDNYLYENFTYVICGLPGQYISTSKYDFYDINLFPVSSPSGMTMASINRSVVTVGSQSGIPNLSNLMETPTIQWGNEEHLHKKVYNVKNTECIFINDDNFVCSPDIVLSKLKTFLQKLNKEK